MSDDQNQLEAAQLAAELIRRAVASRAGEQRPGAAPAIPLHMAEDVAHAATYLAARFVELYAKLTAHQRRRLGLSETSAIEVMDEVLGRVLLAQLPDDEPTTET